MTAAGTAQDNGEGVLLRPKFGFQPAIPDVLVAAAFGRAAARCSQHVEPMDQGLLAAHRQLHSHCGWLAAVDYFLP